MDQQTTKATKEQVFVKLSDLERADLKQFEQFPVTFLRTQKNGRENVSISLNIEPKLFNRLVLRDGDNYLNSDKFNLIALEIDLPLEDENGRPISQWQKRVYTRFVTGKSKTGSDYHYVEVLFKKGVYLVHFLGYDQVNLLQKLEEKRGLKIKWIQRPDVIETALDELKF